MITNPNNEHREQAQAMVDEFNALLMSPSLIDVEVSYDNLKSRIISALSSLDAEVRTVLEGLRNPHRHVDLCWCDHDARFEPHDAACLATQALYTKLQPGKEGEDVDKQTD